MNAPTTIPKVIHYCWFGGKPLPASAKKCIKSWKKYLPDYEIKEWNESNFDISANTYAAQAYNAKKYAFVSDYARFWILYRYGGLYFDTDVEVIRKLDDIIAKGPFMGCENSCNESEDTIQNLAVAPGLGLGVNPGLGLYKDILDLYDSLTFINPDGSYNLTTVVEYTSGILRNYGLQNINSMQQVAGCIIYPKEYFCPKDFFTGKCTITPNTRTIHHYSASWVSRKHLIYNWVERRLGKKFMNLIYRTWKRLTR